MTIMKHKTMNITIKVKDFLLVRELETFGWRILCP